MHNVGTWPGALREAADSAPPTPATNHWFQPSPTLRPCMYVCAVMRQTNRSIKQTHCDSVETVVRKKRRLLFAGAVAKKHNGRLPRRVMFGVLSGGKKPKPGRPEKIWLDCVSDDLKAFQATSGPTEDSPSVFGVETALWTTAAKRWDKWHDGSWKGRSSSWRSGTNRKRRRGACAMQNRWHKPQGIARGGVDR